MGKENPTKAGNFLEIDSVQTTNWSLKCISHEINKLTCELTNLQTNRVHKLIFSGGGTDSITEPSFWTEGAYSSRFNTKFPAGFENFDNTLAIITNDGPGTFTHTFRIGFLATIRLAQTHSHGMGTWNLAGICRIEYGGVKPKKYEYVGYDQSSRGLSISTSIGY